MAATQLNQIRDLSGAVVNYNTGALQFSAQNADITLTTDTVAEITAPAGPAYSYMAIIRPCNCTPYMLPASTPALTLPTGTQRETLAMLVPAIGLAGQVRPGQTLQFLTDQDNTPSMSVSVAFYQMPGSTYG